MNDAGTKAPTPARIVLEAAECLDRVTLLQVQPGADHRQRLARLGLQAQNGPAGIRIAKHHSLDRADDLALRGRGGDLVHPRPVRVLLTVARFDAGPLFSSMDERVRRAGG